MKPFDEYFSKGSFTLITLDIHLGGIIQNDKCILPLIFFFFFHPKCTLKMNDETS